MSRYALMSAASQRVVGVALGLVWFTRRDRHAGADRQRQRRVPAGCSRDGLVGPATGGRDPRRLARPRHSRALHCRRATTLDNRVLEGGLARLVRRCTISCGQGRESHRCVPEYRVPLAKLRAAPKGRLGRRPGCAASPWYASAML